jgi:hypothetical protein
VQLFDDRDEMFEPAAEPVQSPDHERVAGGEDLEAGIELGARCLSDPEPTSSHTRRQPGLLERVELQREVPAWLSDLHARCTSWRSGPRPARAG